MGAIAYGFAIKHISLRTMLAFGISTSALSTLFYLYYNSHAIAPVIDGASGLFGTMAEVALWDLMARATPRGSAGLGYSLIMSARNLALFGADYIGSWMHDNYHLSFQLMVWISGLTTAVVLIFLPLMPRALMGSKDRE